MWGSIGITWLNGTDFYSKQATYVLLRADILIVYVKINDVKRYGLVQRVRIHKSL